MVIEVGSLFGRVSPTGIGRTHLRVAEDTSVKSAERRSTAYQRPWYRVGVAHLESRLLF